MRKILLYTIAFMFITILTAYGATQLISDTVKVQLRQHAFLIPKRNVLAGQSVMPEWLLRTSGFDDGVNSALLIFRGGEIKEAVSDYKVSKDNQFKDDIEVLMAALTPKEIANYRDPNTYADLGDLWRATDSYKNRKIEPAETPGLYKVYRVVEYPRSWSLVNQLPDSTKPVPDKVSEFWVAHCFMLGPKGKRSIRCTTHEMMNDIVLEFSLSDYNLPKLDRVRGYIRSKVREWKQ